MSRLFFDTNVMLDIVAQERRYSEDSRKLLSATFTYDADVYLLSSSIKDVYYIYNKSYGTEERAREQIRMLRTVGTVVDLTDALVGEAIDSNEPDFEDGLVRAAAESVGADAIVTHDAAGFALSPVPKMSAAEALAWLQGR